MSLLRLHLLRHGQTSASRDNLYSGRRRNPPLTEQGIEMAREFAVAYRDRRWAAIYSSPLGRALATAAPLADAVQLPVLVRDGFAEIDYGDWDGLTPEEVAERFPIEQAKWIADPAWNPPTGGETAVALAQRVTRELERIEHEHHAGGNVLIVAHKATIRVAICALLGVDVGRFRYRFDCPVGSVTIIEFRAHGPFAVAIADRSHLDARLRGLEGT
ncbi:MAG TPA: histidine phosphatase family protein [Gemmatimonadaceae bacterium]|jgi:probable phosphoglycerate mutase|nr:histidine phosphatase family protein [Gemmatimonadaceae bacterium]